MGESVISVYKRILSYFILLYLIFSELVLFFVNISSTLVAGIKFDYITRIKSLLFIVLIVAEDEVWIDGLD